MRFRLCLATLLFYSFLSAAPVGNTAAPRLIDLGFFIPRSSWLNVRVGYEGDFVTDGKLMQYKESRVDNFKQITNAAAVTLNVRSRLDVYGVLGGSEVKSDWRFILEDGSVHRIKMETGTDFLWAAGARAILFEWGRASLGTGGRYSTSQYQLSWLTTNGAPVDAANTYFDWKEWQVNLDLSYQINLLTPYIGVKYSQAEVKMGKFPEPIGSNEIGDNQFKNRTPVGLFLGCAISNGNYFLLNLEARLIDEEAFTLSGDFRF